MIIVEAIKTFLTEFLTAFKVTIKYYLSGEAFKEDYEEVVNWLYKVN